jgi:hypothetical protein
VKIRLYKWLWQKALPLLDYSYDQLRKRAAMMKFERSMQRYYLNVERMCHKELKKRAALHRVGNLDQKFQLRSIKTHKAFFFV